MSETDSEKFDSEFFREAVADAETIRETAIENAKDHLEEAFTPKLQSMLSQTIQQEMEGGEEAPDMEDGEEEEDEVELDLTDVDDDDSEPEFDGEGGSEEEDEEEVETDDEEEEEPDFEDEEEMEEITDQDELDLESVMEFLEAATMDDRHDDPDTSDDRSEDNPHRYGDEMLDTDEFEDGYESDTQEPIMDDVNKIAQELEKETELQEELEDEMVNAFLEVLSEEEDEEEVETDDEEEEEEQMEETVFDVDLNEFGVTSTDRDPMDGLADVSGPYDTETDPNIDAEAGEGVDVGGEAYLQDEPGSQGDSDTEDIDQPLNTDNLYEEDEVEYDLSALLEDDTTVDNLNEAEQLRAENRELKEELQKHRQAIKILREKINETNLINSKLLYTNRLFKKFGLNDRQKMKVIESFDRASDTREAKLIYTTLAENFNKQQGSSSEQVNESRKSSKKDKLVEALESGLGSEKTGGSTTPSDDKKQILNENSDLKDRFQKLADLK